MPSPKNRISCNRVKTENERQLYLDFFRVRIRHP